MHDLKKHPGLFNKSGHIGFLGHGSVVEFRDMRIKELDGDASSKEPDGGVTGPPEGFTALFNGKDLTGWHGMGHFNPYKLAAMKPEKVSSQLHHSRNQGWSRAIVFKRRESAT